MSKFIETIEAAITKSRLALDEASYRIEYSLDHGKSVSDNALGELESIRFHLEDIQKAANGLSKSYASVEGENRDLRDMIAEYDAKIADLEEAVRYLSGTPDEPVDDWKEGCPLN